MDIIPPNYPYDRSPAGNYAEDALLQHNKDVPEQTVFIFFP
jgi:hypothetical protein